MKRKQIKLDKQIGKYWKPIDLKSPSNSRCKLGANYDNVILVVDHITFKSLQRQQKSINDNYMPVHEAFNVNSIYNETYNLLLKKRIEKITKRFYG